MIARTFLRSVREWPLNISPSLLPPTTTTPTTTATATKILHVKKMACKIIQSIMDMELNSKISFVVKEADRIVNGGDSSVDADMNEQMAGDHTIHLKPSKLAPLLLNLTLFGMKKLVRSCFALLFFLYREEQNLRNSVSKVLLLSDPRKLKLQEDILDARRGLMHDIEMGSLGGELTAMKVRGRLIRLTQICSVRNKRVGSIENAGQAPGKLSRQAREIRNLLQDPNLLESATSHARLGYSAHDWARSVEKHVNRHFTKHEEEAAREVFEVKEAQSLLSYNDVHHLVIELLLLEPDANAVSLTTPEASPGSIRVAKLRALAVRDASDAVVEGLGVETMRQSLFHGGRCWS